MRDPKAVLNGAGGGALSEYRYVAGHEACTKQYIWPLVGNLLGPPGGRHVLDAGCGDGGFCQYLESLGFSVSGFDASESGVALATKKVQTGMVLQVSAYEDLRAAFGRRFDSVTALEVIEHLYAPRVFLRRLGEMLEPGAPLILSTPYHGYFKNLALAAYGRLDAHFTVLWDGGHIKFFSPKTIRRMLEECGYRVVALRGAGRVPWLWKSMIVLARKVEPPQLNLGR
jgi:2-polyprenyl-6-hydroxyphenyl methylase/3-demethylubiquinone-9 3-methyltransferase